jgi:hypothetical protein
MNFGKTLGVLLLGAACAAAGEAAPADGPTAAALQAYRAKRLEAAHRRRRLIFNNDGDDAIIVPRDWPATAESLLKLRTAALVGSQVDSIFYCTLQGPMSLHRTQVGETLTANAGDYYKDGSEGEYFAVRRNVIPELLAQGTDPLQIMIGFCRDHSLEVFCSMRMNDTHDGGHRPDKPYWAMPRFKLDHPEYLVGSFDKRPQFGSWTAFDYAQPAVRELTLRRLHEVCRNYDVDGLELDFFRHGVLFKTVAWGGKATPEERDAMTDMLRRVRQSTEVEGLRRGKPILLAVRVPDSVEYCLGIGLDLERWLREGLVDVLVTTCYFRLNPWEYSVELGHRYNVPVYACLSESRASEKVDGKDGEFGRNSRESYRARAMDAWQAGVDGIYMFNFFNPAAPEWRELGDAQALRGLDKVYFVTVRNANPAMWLAGGGEFQTLPNLTPQKPAVIARGTAQGWDVRVGDDLAGQAQDGKAVSVRCHLRVKGLARADEADVRLNGQRLTGGVLSEGRLAYDLDPRQVRCGVNRVEVGFATGGAEGAAPRKTGWDVFYRGDHLLQMPDQLPWRRLVESPTWPEEVRDGALWLGDQDKGPNDMVNLMYPWTITPDDETIVEARAKVVASDDPRAVTVRVANGAAVEYLTLNVGSIGLYYAGKRYEMDTTSAFHTYRIIMQGKDIRVLVDGQQRLDGTGLLTTSALDHSQWLKLAEGNDDWNQRSLLFGSASGPGTGSACWEYIAYLTQAQSLTLYDLLLAITHK